MLKAFGFKSGSSKVGTVQECSKTKQSFTLSLSLVAMAVLFCFVTKSRYNNFSDIPTAVVEAVSSGENGGYSIIDYPEYAFCPQTGTMIMKHGINKINKGKVLNTCEAGGTGCVLAVGQQTFEEKESTASYISAISISLSALQLAVAILGIIL